MTDPIAAAIALAATLPPQERAVVLALVAYALAVEDERDACLEREREGWEIPF